MSTSKNSTHFHYGANLQALLDELPQIHLRQDTEFTYTFENFFHPFVGELISQLNTNSLSGIFDPEFQAKTEEFFTTYYGKLETKVVKVDSSRATARIDLDDGGPYANYNWELLFHIP